MKIMPIFLFMLGVVLLPVIAFLNNTGGFLAKIQTDAAIQQTNAGGYSWQWSRVITQLQDYQPFFIFICVFALGRSILLYATRNSHDLE